MATQSVASIAPTHPYASTVSLRTRSAIKVPVPRARLAPSASSSTGLPYDLNVVALYAKHDARMYAFASKCWCSLTYVFTEACRFVTINLSSFPVPGAASTYLMDCFPSTSTIKSFLVRHDNDLHSLASPFHVFYCSDSYAGRYNPNAALVLLTKSVVVSSRRPWYGTVLVFKFASTTYQDYIDMTVDDVLQVRNYFAFFA